MQIWSCAFIVTIPGEEELKFCLCLCLFLARDMLYAEGANAENAVLGAEGVWS